MNLVVAYGPVIALLVCAVVLGFLAERWTRRQDLRVLNFEYEMLCVQMVMSEGKRA